MRKLLSAITLIALVIGQISFAATKTAAEAPDLAAIKAETINEDSRYYYPSLLQQFMANDTLMTNEDFQYFYYGTLFQEDYDPYRAPYDEEALKEIEPLYYQSSLTNAQKEQMIDYAMRALRDNPLDLIQLKNLVYAYEQRGKVNLAKIWKNKLNHLLLTIASSGTGLDPEKAWYVVYPRHEFDFLNISGKTVQSREFTPPYYEKVSVNAKSEKDPGAYYFNLQPVLEQYYIKHPSEAE